MSWPIHSELMEPVARAVAPVVAACRSIRDPAIPYYGPDGKRRIRRRGGRPAPRQRSSAIPTLWNATFEAMVRDGDRVFLEVGPGQMLSKFARWIDRSVTCHPAGTLARD